ncbi:uncharacterized protein LOC143857029 [Tasmannia lanceolata]|uniref:uncharacterized protein LOC143857029 n=1 Tax=Tasmannia lanceolata TaxID=3420 RepID=UPI0040644FA8
MMTFLVVDVPFTYNAIIGRPVLRDLGAVVSTPHLKMKFPTQEGVGEVRGHQMVARRCYFTSLKGTNAPEESFTIDSQDPRDRARTVRGKPVEELDSISMSEAHPNRTIRICSLLTGISPKVTVHKLNVNPAYKLAREKTRNFDQDRDPYPLPRIDQFIDATFGHELLSFLDAFSGYNQIKMHEPDIPKTAFITKQGLYCYTVMPFGLKNAGTTYQRLVNKLFHKHIRRNVEVYVDDMLVKSLKAQQHINDLQETFDILHQFEMKLYWQSAHLV